MHAITAIYGAVLFVLLTPGLILRIPSKGSLLTASIVHAIVFGILFYLISKLVYQYWGNRESFYNTGKKPKNMVDDQTCHKIINIKNQLNELISSLRVKEPAATHRLLNNALDILTTAINNRQCKK